MKERSIEAIKRACDRLYSEIRRRDAALEHSNRHGGQGDYAACCSCDKVNAWRAMDAGHYFTRSHNSTRYEDCNVHAQCKECNGGEGNQVGFKQFLLKRYGTRIIEVLMAKKNETCALSRTGLLAMEADFKIRLTNIRKVTI